jgi:Leucine-rich repeat (LRR) protein
MLIQILRLFPGFDSFDPCRSSLELHAPLEIHAGHQSPVKLPLIRSAPDNSKLHLPGSVAPRVNLLRSPASQVLIKPSTLEDNGHEDEHGSIVSSVCVGLGASGFDPNVSEFDRLESVDFGDNKITFADAGVFPSLKMLNLYCNGISSLQHPASAFKHLEVLNLSFNLINAETILPIFAIKSLVVLDLSFNMISRIPNRWHSLPQLKILSMEKNGLHHEESFSYLSLAPSLQELNLSSNRLSCVPASCSAPGRFPQLMFISLVDNLFSHEKDVVALSSVPSIQQVDLWNNPMSSNSGTRSRSRRAIKPSRSPSPKIQPSLHQEPSTVVHDGFLRVLTPANFQRCSFQTSSSPSPGSVALFSMRPKRALADVEQEAREVFRDGYVYVPCAIVVPF